ncbi:AraC family transcriptional regulator [Rhodococcus enclensis]|nr:AraC family transcriptional regulator [Rhodococcus qingshengii]
MTRLEVSGTTAPLPVQSFLDTRDLDEAEQKVGALLTEHRLVMKRNAGDFRARVTLLPLADLTIAHFAYGAELAINSRPLGCYAVAIVLRGALQIRSRSAETTATPGEAIVFSTSDPVPTLNWSRDFEMLCVAVPDQALHESGRRLFEIDIESILFEPFVGAQRGHMFRSVVASALERSSGGSEMLPSRIAWQIRDSLVAAMLTELKHDRNEEVHYPRITRSSRVIDAAVAVMKQSLADSPSIPEIARAIGVGERTLHAAFKQERRTTPAAYLKRLRLEAVREEFFRRSPELASVGDIAISVGGFHHLGRFAHDYHLMTGEYPSETLRRRSPAGEK